MLFICGPFKRDRLANTRIRQAPPKVAWPKVRRLSEQVGKRMAEDRAASRGASSKGRTHHLMIDRLTLRAIQSVASAFFFFFFFSWQWELARQVAANSPLCLPQLLQNDPFGRTALGAPTSGLRRTGCSAVVICVWRSICENVPLPSKWIQLGCVCVEIELLLLPGRVAWRLLSRWRAGASANLCGRITTGFAMRFWRYLHNNQTADDHNSSRNNKCSRLAATARSSRSEPRAAVPLNSKSKSDVIAERSRQSGER